MSVCNHLKVILIGLLLTLSINVSEAKSFLASRGVAAKSVGKSFGGKRPGVRTGKQSRLRQLANDKSISRSDRGWVRQEINSIARGNRKTIRLPPGKQLSHHRGYEANKGFDYGHSSLNEKGLHQLQHKHDSNGRKNIPLWSKKRPFSR